MNSWRKIILIATFVVPLEPARAMQVQQDLPPIYVSGEAEAPGLQACQVSYLSARAAVEAALRYSRVPVATRDDYVRSRAIRAYVNINAIRHSATHQTCSADVSLQFHAGGRIVDPTTGRTHDATIEFCELGSLLIWEISGLQARINSQLRDYVDQCIVEYRASIRTAAG
jgi:hypothetical protein